MYKVVDGKRVYNAIYVVSYVPQEIPEGGENFVDYSKRIVLFTLKNKTWQQALNFCRKYYGKENVISRQRYGEIIIY